MNKLLIRIQLDFLPVADYIYNVAKGTENKITSLDQSTTSKSGNGSETDHSSLVTKEDIENQRKFFQALISEKDEDEDDDDDDNGSINNE